MKQELVHQKNAVLDHPELQQGLKKISSKFGDFVIRVASEAWKLPLIDQKTKALIAIAIDVVNQDHIGSGNFFAAHLKMALQQGATPAEIEELLLFLCVYGGFNKVAACFATFNLIIDELYPKQRKAIMLAESKQSTKTDYSAEDQQGQVAFYVLLWKKPGISVELFENYWRNVHGPVCARLPGQYQYWQFRVDHDQMGYFPQIPGLDYISDPEENFDSIAELTFTSEAERNKWFAASAILMDDEHNLFRKAIGYNTSPGNSITYINRIVDDTANGEIKAIKFHVMVRKADGVSTQAFRQYLTTTFAPSIVHHDLQGGIVSLMSSSATTSQTVFNEINGKPKSLGHYLQGLQHVGITVSDMTKALEFYVEVLGGKPAIGGDGFIGDELHNLLFQKEDLEAWKTGINPKSLGVPDIRDGSQESLDVRFISFGNTCVELIHFRDAKLTPTAPGIFDKIPSGIGHVNAPHLSFHVKDDVDLDAFAKMLEDECQKRGIENVVANRIIHIDSETARQNAPLKYAKLDLIGDFDGWLLFYCKGPNGEQLEFNQVKRKAREMFTKAQKEYNLSNGTDYWFYDNIAPVAHNSNQRIFNTFSANVNASVEKIWEAWTNQTYSDQFPILERYPNGVLREAKMPGMEMKQRLTIDKEARSLTIDLVDHPLFTGRFINHLHPPSSEPGSLPIITYTIDLQPKSDLAFTHPDGQGFIEAAKLENVQKAVYQLKANVESSTTNSAPNEGKTMTQSLVRSGQKSEIVRRMFEAGESMNVDNFVKFYTEDAHYQFSNFPVAYGPQGIKDTSVGFLQTVAKVHHYITNIWEQGDTVICEMEVTYIRHDGKVFRLPCCDTIVFKGDKVQELRIYMDISPVFQTEEVKPQAAVSSDFLLQRIGKMYEALHAGNWEEFKTFFTPDLLYKVGANEAVIGPDACVGFLQHIYKTLKLTTHNARGTWAVGNTVILEMDANYVNKVDKRFVQVPCTDIYRFDGDRIYEWRVYPDPSQLNLKF
ncbi:nuclear transport factor 2 family protein [Dolichospermum sp. UHCC 0259]|uniref:nuclear transport factor 2 family protein n=1 Tax=Dolichospermum sp. UHCC 0259 TaxID=2590010 RepID=UPI0014483888|nr:nuclear transport factor 2 family protein [Dolichospermum sp. UHCC 0259]MTJ46746.1 carboxymuconolactone decarboxylase [Dolichospermum sp. UHCC 0259]